MKPAVERSINGGEQKIFSFPNGYGASVVRHDFSYGGKSGLWELAVLTMSSTNPEDYSICYDTEITDDVIGHLSESDVQELLTRISKLKEG